MTTLLFAHGKESGPWGSKIRYLADIALHMGARVISPDYTDLPSPEARVERLLSMALTVTDDLILVGSSMGGYVSILASQMLKPKGLFLMAPAVYLPGYAEQNPLSGAVHTCVVFGRQDEVIPVDNGIRFAAQNRADLHLTEGDHRLNGQIAQVGVLFKAFLERLEVGLGRPGFQTPETLAALARPFLGKSFHRCFATFDTTKPLSWTPHPRDLEACRPDTDYGDMQVAFWEGGDLCFATDCVRDGMGGPPVLSLRLCDQSIPQRYAEADVRQPHDRSADRICRYFPLRWRDLVHPGLLSERRRDVLRGVWLTTWDFPGVYGPIPCVCGIALQFDRKGPPETPGNRVYLGVYFDPLDEESAVQTWLRPALPALPAPPGTRNPWQCVLGANLGPTAH